MMLAVVQLGRDAGDLVQEAPQHLLAVRGVHHLGVVLHPGQPPAGVLERGHRGTGRRAR